MMTAPAPPVELRAAFEHAAARARATGLFASINAEPARLICAARHPEGEAEYRIEWDEGALWVSWVSPNRWLSQSIEAEMKWLHIGLAELVESIGENCRDAGYTGPELGPVKHFRSQDKLYTFRSRLPITPQSLAGDGAGHAGQAMAQCLEAYEATFRELGDMREKDD